MEPQIGRSIGAGFRAANQSWPALALFFGVWLVVVRVVGFGVTLTKPPTEALQQRPAEPAAQTQTNAAGGGAAPAEAPKTGLTRAEQERVAMDWLKHAWPMLVVCALLLFATTIWTTGGQIGYLAARVSGGAVPLSTFWQSGTRAFRSVLGAWLLSVSVVVGIGAVIALPIILGASIPGTVPAAVFGALGLIVGLAAVVALVWLSVRIACWFIAVVVDRMGPVAGFRASFKATRGRWWQVAGLSVLLLVISAGAMLVLNLVGWLAGLAVGPASVALELIAGLLRSLASVYIGFASLAAYIRWYEDVKTTG